VFSVQIIKPRNQKTQKKKQNRRKTAKEKVTIREVVKVTKPETVEDIIV